MLELFGSGYVIDHCIAAYNDRQEQLSWQIYMADSAAAIINGLGGESRFPRWWNLIHKEQKEERTGDEIALDVLLRSGLKARPRKQEPPEGEDAQ